MERSRLRELSTAKELVVELGEEDATEFDPLLRGAY